MSITALAFLDDLLGDVGVGLGDGEVEGAAAHAGLVERVQVGTCVDEHAGGLQKSRENFFNLIKICYIISYI